MSIRKSVPAMIPNPAARPTKRADAVPRLPVYAFPRGYRVTASRNGVIRVGSAVLTADQFDAEMRILERKYKK